MTAQPSVTPVAIASLLPPWPHLTFYTDPVDSVTPLLHYSYGENTWRELRTGVNVELTSTSPVVQATSSPTTAYLWWNKDASEIGWRLEATRNAPIIATAVKVVSSLSLSSPTPTSPRTEATASSTDSSASASQTSAPTPAPTSSKGISTGAAVGITIGCFVAALVAGFLVWFYTKRRRYAVECYSETSSCAVSHHEKGPDVKTLSLDSSSAIITALENGLPLPLDDKALSGEISKISSLIKNHVQSYYHSGRVSPVMIDYDDIQALGTDLPVSVGMLSTLLGNSATREIALRFCIAWAVVSRMQLNCLSSGSFLPPEVSECLQAMSRIDRNSRVHSTLFSKWRAITAELMQSTYMRAPFTAGDPRLRTIQTVASLLDNILRPYCDSRMDDGQRSQNLEEILKRSAVFAFTLFSQPGFWDFDWQSEQSLKSGSLCIFPALIQVRNEDGEPIRPVRPVSDVVIRRLDE